MSANMADRFFKPVRMSPANLGWHCGATIIRTTFLPNSGAQDLIATSSAPGIVSLRKDSADSYKIDSLDNFSIIREGRGVIMLKVYIPC